MKNNIRLVFCIMFLMIIFTGCQKEQDVLPRLQVTGDLSEWVNINETWGKLEKTKIAYGENKIYGIDMHDLIHSFDLIYNDLNIVIKAEDGFMVLIDGETLQDTYLGYSKSNHWVYISEKHPVNSRIKFINEIIIVKKDTEPNNYSNGLNIIHNNETLHMSMGQLLCHEYSICPYFDGQSSFEYNGEVSKIDVIKQKKIINLTDLVKEDIDNILIMNEDGLHEYERDVEGYIEIDQNYVNYMKPDGSLYYRDIEGIIINPPKYSVMDTYYDALHYVENDEKVLILFLDGFSHRQYQYLKVNKPDFYLSGVQGVKKATTVFKPVTNAGFAAMITGQSPMVNGVMNRQKRELKVDSIFDKVTELNKKSILIEGNVSILNTSTKPILNIDENNNGFTDDEIFLCAKNLLKEDYDLALVHFHSIDDMGHRVGDINDDVMEQIKEIDKYVEELVSNWHGKVIVVADHGMHTTTEGGSHGEFRAKDLFIPYVVINGG